jgi:DNA-binding response OmpR family regulator
MTKEILLIVGDDALRSSLFRKLIQIGYEVIETSDVREGLRMIYEKKPHAVILDFGLFEKMVILEERNASAILRTIPIIAIAHPGQEREVELAKEFGIPSFVSSNESDFREFFQQIEEIVGPPY